ncbi:MAG: guanitoxin biosynthesis L-enduracididine beta-hydroxylase GntD [Vicinamibacterales bacterium]
MIEPWTYRLSGAEVDAVERVIEPCLASGAADDPESLRRFAIAAQELPRGLRRVLYEFRVSEPQCGMCLLSGFPIHDDRLGPTPPHWVELGSSVSREQCYLFLVSSLVGDPMGWATQQDGHLVHHVFPIRAHEDEQLGTGSRELLSWHNEDAFHPLRPDYVGLMCLRNREGVPTMLASLEGLDLPGTYIDRLFEPHFRIRPDNSHQPKHQGAHRTDVSYDQIETMSERPEKIPVLSGDRSSPYLRLDPYFMDPVESSVEAQQALDALIRFIDAHIRDVVLQPGDICLLDNYKAVHGRRAFDARYDGTDRWLLRVNATRDLRKSRHCRRSSQSRILC